MNHSRKLVEHGSYKILLGSNPKSDPISNQKEETREKQNMKKKRNTDFELDRKIFKICHPKISEFLIHRHLFSKPKFRLIDFEFVSTFVPFSKMVLK